MREYVQVLSLRESVGIHYTSAIVSQLLWSWEKVLLWDCSLIFVCKQIVNHIYLYIGGFNWQQFSSLSLATHILSRNITMGKDRYSICISEYRWIIIIEQIYYIAYQLTMRMKCNRERKKSEKDVPTLCISHSRRSY